MSVLLAAGFGPRRWLPLAMLGLLLVASPGGGADSAVRGAVEEAVQVRWDRGRRLLSLRAPGATLEQIGAALAQATGCAVEIDAELRGQRLTLDLAPRAPERLFPVLARRASARLSVSYRLEPLPAGETQPRSSPVFAGQEVSLELPQPVELAAIWKRLGIRVESGEGVSGQARVFAARHPLARVLDQVTEQVQARWEAVVRLEPRTFVDAEAAAYERMRSHFSDLARLSPDERREELAADLEALEKLPPERRAEAARRVAEDILSLATLLQEVPGEHRLQIAPRVLAVAGDYVAVLSRLPEDRRVPFEPAFHALRELQQRLSKLR